MRLRITGDWAAPIVFTVSSTWSFWQYNFYSTRTVDLAGEPITTSSRVLLLILILACLYGFIALASTIAAVRGRKVPDGSTWEAWKNVGMDIWGIIGSIGLVSFGGGLVIFMFDKPTPIIQIILISLMSFGFLWAGIKLTLGAWIVVFTPEKSVITFCGKPFAFLRRTYQTKDFSELRLVSSVQQAGGLYAYHPSTNYLLFGIHHGRAVELDRMTIAERQTDLADVRAMVEEIAKKTGLPAPEVTL